MIDNRDQILSSAQISSCQGELTGSIKIPSEANIQYQLRGSDTRGNEFSHRMSNSDVITLDSQSLSVTSTLSSIIINSDELSNVHLIIMNTLDRSLSHISSQISAPPDIRVSLQSEPTFSLLPKESIDFQFSLLGSNLPPGTSFDITINLDDNCTVADFSFSIFVKSSIPVHVSNIETNNLTLTWTQTSMKFETYSLYFETESDLITVEVDNETYTYTLQNLNPYQLIYYSIVAVNADGVEVAGSPQMAVRTQESSKIHHIYFSCMHTILLHNSCRT